jgi:hypothetical protein
MSQRLFHANNKLGSARVVYRRPGASHTQHRAGLYAHTSYVLKDSIKAEEITPDASFKLMLAAPEFESVEHALSCVSSWHEQEAISSRRC